MQFFNEPLAVGGGYQAQPPPIGNPGYGGETIPDMNVVFMDNDIPEDQRAEVIEQVKGKGFVEEIPGQPYGIMTLPTSELNRLLNILNTGAPINEILDGTTGELHADFEKAIQNYVAGRNVIITDSQTSFAIKFFPGRGIFIHPGSTLH